MPNHKPLLPITVAVPVKNEEANLARCLERLERFAEVVVIDSGSTDRTLEIAESFDARIINFRWNGCYPKKRNWFLLNEPPSQPWVLFLDADEFLGDDFCDALSAAVKDNGRAGYWLRYTNYFLGKPLHHGIPQRKLAFFRTGAALYEKIDEVYWSSLDMEVHEHPIVTGEVGEIITPIDHQDFKGLATFISKHRDYALWEAARYKKLISDSAINTHLSPRQRFKYQHMSAWWHPWFYFSYTYFWKRGFLDGSPGFHYAFFKAWYFQTIRLLIRETKAKS